MKIQKYEPDVEAISACTFSLKGSKHKSSLQVLLPAKENLGNSNENIQKHAFRGLLLKLRFWKPAWGRRGTLDSDPVFMGFWELPLLIQGFRTLTTGDMAPAFSPVQKQDSAQVA